MKSIFEILQRRLQLRRQRLSGHIELQNWKGCIEHEAIIDELEMLWEKLILEGYSPTGEEK
jgi:hypothetical protein